MTKRSAKTLRKTLGYVFTIDAVVALMSHHPEIKALALFGAFTALFALYHCRRPTQRRRSVRRPVARKPAPRKRQTWKMVWSAACAGNDHAVCTDRFCTCPCGHPSIPVRQPAPANRYPLPAEDVPPF
jgi:hypothetical protein